MGARVDPGIIAGFVKEVESYLPKLDRSLAVYRADPAQVETLAEAHRMVHCIRGAGSTLGLLALSRIAQYEEETLEQVLAGRLPWSEEAAAVLSDNTRQIARYIREMAGETLSERDMMAEVVRRHRRLRGLPVEGDEAEILEALAAAQGAPEGDAGAPPDGSGEEGEDRLETVEAAGDLWESFQREAEENLLAIGEGLASLDATYDAGMLGQVRKCLHTLKGACALVGLRKTGRLARCAQETADAVLQGRLDYTPELSGLLALAYEALADSIVGQGTGRSLVSRVAELVESFEAAAAESEPAPPSPPKPAIEELADKVEGPEDLWEAFQQEAEEHLQSINEQLREMDPKNPSPAAWQAMRRRVHTFKGAAGIVGMRLTARLAHRMEDLLDALYENRLAFREDVPPLLFATFDVLSDAAAARGLPREQHARVTELYRRYDAIMAGAASCDGPGESAAVPAGPAPPAAEEREQVAPQALPAVHRKQAQFVRAPLERVDELVRLVSELVIHRSIFEQYLGAYAHEVGEMQLSIERLSRVSRKLQADYEAAALQESSRRMAFSAAGGRGYAGDFDPLELDRYSEFHLLSRDLAETTGDIGATGSRLNDLIADFDGYLTRLGTLTGDVEDRLMRLRMLPLRSVATRLHRTVRVTAERRAKQVELVMEGEAVDLDKTVLDEMAGPLEHLLRNAVDHGIESPAVRGALGKPARGRITIKAYNEGTQVVLQVRDDGAGLDPERLREKAIRTGVLSEADAALVSNDELYSVIFLPGFSTASELSDISGRGVGLDVVKAAVSKLKGTISVGSERGRGVTFTIRLPMTLALTKVALVKAGNETVAVPLAAVGQILRLEPEQLERVGRKVVLRLAGKVVPALHLAEVIGLKQVESALQPRLKVLVLHIGDQQLALMVDQVVEAREVVVKTMGSLLGRVQAITGATILGDGSVVLILNPNDLIQQQYQTAAVRFRTPTREQQAARPYEVLIVDDSPSVRRVLSNLAKNAGWNAHTAKDGIEALDVLNNVERAPDVVLLDIEMPRMDGYEFTAALRGQYAYRNVPVIMLTSRAGEKHRQKAFEMGANEYLVKPYQEEDLLATVRRVVGEARRQTGVRQ